MSVTDTECSWKKKQIKSDEDIMRYYARGSITRKISKGITCTVCLDALNSTQR